MRTTNATEPSGDGGAGLMVRTNVYVPRWLIVKARARRLNVSRVCSDALKAALGEPERNLVDRIHEVEGELRALQAQSLAQASGRWELESIRQRAGWRFNDRQTEPSLAFSQWWKSESIRMDFPNHANLDPLTVWQELKGVR